MIKDTNLFCIYLLSDLDFKEFLRKKHSPPGSTPQTGNERSKSYQVSPPQTEPNNDTFEPEVPNSNGIQHENDVKVEVIETFPYYEAVLESNEGSPGQFFGNDENEDANQDEDDNLEDMEVDKFSIDPLSCKKFKVFIINNNCRIIYYSIKHIHI